MLFGGSAFGTTPWGADDDGIAGVLSPFYRLITQGTSTEIVLLFDATVRDPVTDSDIPVRAMWSNTGRELRISGTGSAAYPEVMTQPCTVRTVLFGGAPLESASSDSSSRFGDIVLKVDSQKGWSWSRYAWEGSAFTLKIGAPSFALSEFETVIAGIISDVTWDANEIRLHVADPDDPLREDIQQNVYDGGGGLGGVSEITNQKKPLCYGPVFNCRPRLIDPNYNVYQIHDGAVQSISVFDGGIAFNAGGASADMADVYAWTPVAGEWVTSLENGVFRLGNRPGIALTFDALGDADVSLGGYVDQLSNVVKRILLQRSTLTDNDLDGFLALSLTQPAQVGLYLENGEGSVDDAIQTLLAPLLCYRIFTREQKLFVGQLARGGVAKNLPEHSIKSLRRTRGIRAVSTHRLLYQRVGVVQRDTDLATAIDVIDPERAAFVGSEYRETLLETLTERRRARQLETRTSLVDPDAAFAEAYRQAAMAELYPDIYEASVDRGMFDINAGQTVRITSEDFGMEMGREFIVVGAHPNIAGHEVGLTLWG